DFNAIRANSYSGDGEAIELVGGANHNQPAPVLITATDPRGVVRGTLTADPHTRYEIDLYGVSDDGTVIFVQSFAVTTNAEGWANLKLVPHNIPRQAVGVRATATAPGGNTSVLSNAVPT